MSNNQVIMILESLPNELLFHCFDYLNAFDIFHSFDRLNSRLNKLIRSIQLHISLKNIKKSIFDQFCTKIILNPEIKNQFISLHLPDRNKCVQSKVFTSLFSLNEFPNLETLQLIPSKKYRQIFTAYDFPTIELVDVSFSKLQTLSLISLNYSFINTNKTFSIVNLTIAQCPLFKLYEFLKSTPMLKYLHIQHMSHGFSNHNYKHLKYRI
ncbi:hypothetical protein I4U23_011614 [Adineta vaga]|nr:hypothetical protein I4U23_011614 [Adineta vaga]